MWRLAAPIPFNEIGALFGIIHERIRQIEKTAIASIASYCADNGIDPAGMTLPDLAYAAPDEIADGAPIRSASLAAMGLNEEEPWLKKILTLSDDLP